MFICQVLIHKDYCCEQPQWEMCAKEKIDELFSGLPNVFGIGDQILIAGFDEHIWDHDEMLEKVLWICR